MVVSGSRRFGTVLRERLRGPLLVLLVLLVLVGLPAGSLSLNTSGAAVAQTAATDSLPTAWSTSFNETEQSTDLAADGSRKRRDPWDMLGPALLLGGKLALLVLAAVGHLAGKALLASLLSAALSAAQLARQPPRQG